ncbi:MAG: sodium:proline symporter, partial [Candidatus Omnitrophota bacterium]
MDSTFMILSRFDWAIIILYMVISIAIGLYFSRAGSKGILEYFVAGREVNWWLAGTSIVATSFAADTPLVIAAIVRTHGLQGNWYW